MSTVHPLRPQADITRLVEQLEHHAADHNLALAPVGLALDLLPTVRLGPAVTGTDLDEFLAMADTCGVAMLYVVDGHTHLGAAATGNGGPTSLEVQWIHTGVLHTWQATA